jgi:hypothetical protein
MPHLLSLSLPVQEVLKLVLVDTFHFTVSELNGPGSLVGIATAYELEGPGIEFRWG